MKQLFDAIKKLDKEERRALVILMLEHDNMSIADIVKMKEQAVKRQLEVKSGLANIFGMYLSFCFKKKLNKNLLKKTKKMIYLSRILKGPVSGDEIEKELTDDEKKESLRKILYLD